jgi:hypothetical protein
MYINCEGKKYMMVCEEGIGWSVKGVYDGVRMEYEVCACTVCATY